MSARRSKMAVVGKAEKAPSGPTKTNMKSGHRTDSKVKQSNLHIVEATLYGSWVCGGSRNGGVLPRKGGFLQFSKKQKSAVLHHFYSYLTRTCL